MSSNSSISHSAAKKGIAFTYSDLMAFQNWQDRLVWPIDAFALRELGALAIRKSVKFISEVDDDLARQVLVVGIGQIINRFQALSEAAIVVDASRKNGLEIIGGPPELAILVDGESFSSPVSDADSIRSVNRLIQPPKHALLRQIARTKSYTPWYRMPQALLAIDGTVVSHNKLLLQELKRRRISARFVHETTYVSDIRNKALARSAETTYTVSSGRLRALLGELVELVPNLDEVMRARLLAVLELEIGSEIDIVEGDVVEIRKVANLPKTVWSGTNGAYPVRLIASEVVRRNGQVNAFDHGGVAGISQMSELTAVIELLTTTSFTVATPQWKTLLEQSDSLSIAKPLNTSSIRGGDGEPTFKSAFRESHPSTMGKPRVIYVGHPYRGFRQVAIAAVPDSIYWDFQERLVAQISDLPVDLLCKPHPDGFFRGSTVPIQDIAPTSYKRFEEHLDDADVFLFDAPTSTTFMEALCTRRKVVLIDRGHYPFSDGVKPHALERCTIVRTSCDEAGRLSVDKDELADALLTPGHNLDPTWFRTLLVGSAT